MLQFRSFSKISRYEVRDETDKKAIGSFFGITVPTHLYRSLQHWDTEWIKAGNEAHNTDILEEAQACLYIIQAWASSLRSEYHSCD